MKAILFILVFSFIGCKQQAVKQESIETNDTIIYINDEAGIIRISNGVRDTIIDGWTNQPILCSKL